MKKENQTASSIEAQLREDLKMGRLKAGDKLPSTQALAAQFGVHVRVVQIALSNLSGRGVLRRKRKLGTYVNPPAQSLIAGILIGWSLSAENTYMARQLVDLLKIELGSRGYGTQIFDNLFAGFTNNYDHFQQVACTLATQLGKNNFQGFVEYEFDLQRLSNVCHLFNIPRVRYGMPQTGGDVYGNAVDFMHASLDYLNSIGRRKVMFIRKAPMVHPADGEIEAFWSTLRRKNFIRGYVREVFTHDPACSLEVESRKLAEAFIDDWVKTRRNYVPDCLIVADDIMMRGVAAALLKANIRVPQDITIVILANQGIRHYYGVPVVRYEIPQHRVACALADILDLRVRKQPCPKLPILISGSIDDSDST